MCNVCYNYMTYSASSSPKGYISQHSVVVVFHVIIPKPFWEWDCNSQVFLRFGSKDFGGWNQNIGNFSMR